MLERAGNDAAFQRFGFEWQMLYKTNYPQEDENTLHLPFRSMSGLFFTLFIFEKHVYWERRYPEQSNRVAPQEKEFPQVIFLRFGGFRVSWRLWIAGSQHHGRAGLQLPTPSGSPLSGDTRIGAEPFGFPCFYAWKPGASRRSENMALLR